MNLKSIIIFTFCKKIINLILNLHKSYVTKLVKLDHAPFLQNILNILFIDESINAVFTSISTTSPDYAFRTILDNY